MSERELSTKQSIAIWMHLSLYYDENIWHMLDNTVSNSKKKFDCLEFLFRILLIKAYNMKKYKQMAGKS